MTLSTLSKIEDSRSLSSWSSVQSCLIPAAARLLFLSLLLFVSTVILGCSMKAPSLDTPCQKLPYYTKLVSAQVNQTIRELPLCMTYERAEYEKRLLDILKNEASSEELLYERLMLEHLALIPKTYDYENCISSGFLRLASAVYSPSDRAVVLPAWISISSPILLHEVVHHVQNEQVNITSMAPIRGFFHDSALAIGALLEGDAEFITQKLIRHHPQQLLPDAAVQTLFADSVGESEACQVPSTLKDLFAAQYRYGVAFWKHLETYAPQIQRDIVLEQPPLQTRFILHPDTYLHSNLTTKVDDRSDTRCSRSVGELMLRTSLSQFSDDAYARRVAEGLKHDCFQVNTVEASQVQVQWTTQWEREEEAEEFLVLLNTIRKQGVGAFPGKVNRWGTEVLYTFTNE